MRSGKVPELRQENFCLRRDFARTKIRSKALSQKMKESAIRGAMGKIVEDLIGAYDGGKLAGKESLLTFFADIARNLRIEKKDGSKNRRNRWSESTHRIYQVLMKFGGPRSHVFIRKSVWAEPSHVSEALGRE